MTERLHLTDSYLKEWDATIVSVKDDKYIVLDKTAFYATSGGQPFDTGTIDCNGKMYKVKFVKAFGKDVSHEVDSPGLKKGDAVKCKLDWDRRYKLMRMHTAAHIISAVLYNDLNLLITGNQLEEDKSRMDFNMKNFDREKFNKIEIDANKVIEANLTIEISFMEKKETKNHPHLFKLAGVLPKDLDEYRIIKIGDHDIQADGGTHVKTTSEVGKIKIVNLKNKGKDNRRLYWELE